MMLDTFFFRLFLLRAPATPRGNHPALRSLLRNQSPGYYGAGRGGFCCAPAAACVLSRGAALFRSSQTQHTKRSRHCTGVAPPPPRRRAVAPCARSRHPEIPSTPWGQSLGVLPTPSRRRRRRRRRARLHERVLRRLEPLFPQHFPVLRERGVGWGSGGRRLRVRGASL